MPVNFGTLHERTGDLRAVAQRHRIQGPSVPLRGIVKAIHFVP